ncbi:hypothetical protein [Candidatus Amarobacter glycogenicus]|uniref:hypothetical protein n=1 Tax=Candidatus Amarobacter glycogenicus TaxID=3140699 RepID=UPI0031CCB333
MCSDICCAMTATATPGASATYLEERTFYDGLGRVRQVQKEYSSGQWSLVSQRYDGLGNLAASSAPYTSTVSGVTYQAVNWSGLAATQSTSDRLGRVTQVTQADGSKTCTYYQNRQTAVIREQITIQGNDITYRYLQALTETDAWGRLASVKEYLGQVGGARSSARRRPGMRTRTA